MSKPPRASRYHCTFDRFVAGLEQATKRRGHAEHTMTDEGMRVAIATLREAEPVARAVALLGNPLSDTSEVIAGFMSDQARRAEAAAVRADDTECDMRAAEDDALFSVGLALGLILADQV